MPEFSKRIVGQELSLVTFRTAQLRTDMDLIAGGQHLLPVAGFGPRGKLAV